MLADDTVALVSDLYTDASSAPLAGATVLDVGAGPGYFAQRFAAAGARYLAVEPDAQPWLHPGQALRASGDALPLATGSVDVAYSSNVLEHVARPWAMADEMLRVTRPGGLTLISYTVWLGPFGGHETGMWHYLGGERAARRYERRHGHPPKNRYGTSLFPLSAAAGLRWAAQLGDRADVLAAFPRYHPSWAWWAVRPPVFREFATSNLVLALRPRA